MTVTAGLSIFVYAMVDATNVGWGSTQTIGLIALSLLLLAAFVVIELRSRAPLCAVLGYFELQRAESERDQLADRRVTVLDVLLRVALHAAGTPVLVPYPFTAKSGGRSIEESNTVPFSSCGSAGRKREHDIFRALFLGEPFVRYTLVAHTQSLHMYIYLGDG